MKRTALFFLIAFTFPISLFADGKIDLSAWDYYRQIRGNTVPGDGFGTFGLPDEIWPKDKGGLESLRITDPQGNEVPYFIRVERKADSNSEFPVKLLDNKVVLGNKTWLLVDLGKVRRSNRVTLDISNEGFARQAVVEGSLDKTHWRTLLADGLLFDLTNRSHSARKSFLTFPDSNARYLKVTIPLSGQKDALIVQKVLVRAYFPEEGRSVERSFPGSGSKSEKGETVWIIDRGRNDLPLNGVAFDFESHDFYRPVRVEVSNDQKDWSSLSTCGFLYDARKGGTENQWKVSGPETTGRYVRITLTDGDDTPLKVRQITLRHWQRTLVFRPSGMGPHALYYGNEKANSPQYDLATWASKNVLGETSWTLGEEKNNPNYHPPIVPLTERPFFTWGVLGALMALLAWFLWGSFEKLTREGRP